MKILRQINGTYTPDGFKLDNFSSYSYSGKLIHAKGGGGGGVQTVQQNTNPWPGQQPYLKDVFAKAKQQFNAMQGAPSRFYAEPSAQSLDALSMAEQRARAGSPLIQTAQNALMSQLNPDITQNPVYQAALKARMSDILPEIQGQFSGKGAFRSSLAREAEQRAATREAGRLGSELQQGQQRAALLAPKLAQTDYQDIGRLADVGAEREAITQQQIDEQRMRREYPAQALARYANLIQGNYGSSGSQSTPIYRGNRFASSIGGGLGGASLGASLGGPFGAALGGGLGLLSGLF